MTNSNLVRFPDGTYRASAGENWFDGTYDACIEWLIAEGVEEVRLGN